MLQSSIILIGSGKLYKKRDKQISKYYSMLNYREVPNVNEIVYHYLWHIHC